MARVMPTRDPPVIEAYLRQDPALHLYEIGDLDPFFWPATRWWGLLDDWGALRDLVLIYNWPGLPTLVALDRKEPSRLTKLLGRLQGPGLNQGPGLYLDVTPSMDNGSSAEFVGRGRPVRGKA